MRGFAEMVLGLRIQQPAEYRRLLRIRRRIYTRLAPLRAEIVRSAEPIPFEQLDRAAFRPLRDGATWGRVFDCAWLRITGEGVPDAVNPVVLLGIRGEGLVVSPGGELLDSVSTAFQQADLPHSGGRYRPVLEVDTTGPIEFFADVTYNGFILYPLGEGRYHGAYLASRDDTAYGLYYDYLTLVVLAGATKDGALEAELRAALKQAYRAFSKGDLAGARAELAGPLSAASETPLTYSAVGHGHLDMAWLWPVRETQRKAARTYLRAVNAVERREDYIYGTSQPQQLAWMKQRHPELFDRLKQAVAAGRIELQGSFWIEPDTNLPSGESLIRQALVGRRFLQQEFGLADEQLRLCWLPDTFGYNGNLPQLLRGTGMDWFQTIKLAWNKTNVFPHRTFRWAGIDGSEVLVHMPPEGDYNSRAGADNLLLGLARYPERELGTALLVYGSGDGGGGPGEIHHELLDRERDLRGLPRVTLSSASDFFRALEQLPVEHTHHGELYLETHQGTYTTQGAIKRHNRIAERMLHEAEALAAIVGEQSREALEEHWRGVLFNQFHDIIPGSSIERVNREAIADYERIEEGLSEYADSLIQRLPSGPPAALNLTSFARHEHLKVGEQWFEAEVAPYATGALEPAAAHPELSFTDDSMSNGRLSLRFEGGQVVSCVDAAGTEHAGEGLNRLVLHRDPYVWPFNAWDIDPRYVDKPARPLTLVSASTELDGPTVVRTQVLRGPRVEVTQRVVLEAGSTMVRFDTEVEWQQKHRMLRAEFRPTHYGQTAACEIQFGHLHRATTERDSVEAAQFEVPAHKWIATSDEAGGFALLNDGKYGHRAKHGLISLNLLRAPTYPDRTADRGQHRFTYAFMPFAAGDLTPVIAEGYRLNNPLRVVPAVVESVASTSEPGIVIETIKPAEAGTGVVLRLYESLGRGCVTELRTRIRHSRAVATDLLERPLGDASLEELTFRPFEIKTILLEQP